MSAFSDILTSVQQGVIALNNMAVQMKGSFNNILSRFVTDEANISTNTTNIATNTALLAALTGSKITATLGGNVALNNVAAFFDGPSIAQGVTGTWFVTATVSCEDTAGAARFDAELWDGTTVIATATTTSAAGFFVASITLSAFITAPVGNLRISVRDASSVNGSILAVAAGVGGSNICAFRVA